MANYVKNVAIVGAGGNSGSYMAAELVKTGKHTVTAITRLDSKTELPEGVAVKKVDYDDPASLVSALKGHDALIITMGAMAPAEQQLKLIQAAADADIPWILPNAWGADSTNDTLAQTIPIYQKYFAALDLIAKLGKSAYVAVATSFWYEWSLAIPDAYGFDFEKRTVTFFDDGEAKLNTSTWPQVGRAVATLLSFPITPAADGDPKRSLAHFKNSQVFVSSFLVSQKDMLESALRITHTAKDAWTIKKEPAQERFAKAAGLMKTTPGDRAAFGRFLYSRFFFADELGKFERHCHLDNDVLGLPEEDIDEATARAIERSKTPMW